MPIQVEGQTEIQETVARVETEGITLSVSRQLFFLTNRMNLVGILSSRLLAPRESFHKYYRDLLELSPSWVPLLTIRPTAQLVARVVAEPGAGAPVLLQLSQSVAKDPREWDNRMTYVRAASLSDVIAIHFRDSKSLREHRARRYSNVHPHDDLLRVTPELFASASHVEFEVKAPREDAAVDWRQIDRRRGAVSGLLAAADSGEGLAVAAGALGAPHVPRGTLLPQWLTWGCLASGVPVPSAESEAELADRLIFQTAYRILGDWDRTEYWSPLAVLESVANEIRSTEGRPEAQDIVDGCLQHIRQVVDGERDFEPFRNPGSPHVAAKSLLMVLLRPDLGQLLDWSMQETGADPTTRAVSAVLAGRLRGLARESVKLRNKALDDLTAAHAVLAATGSSHPLGVPEFVSNDVGAALFLNGTKIQVSS